MTTISTLNTKDARISGALYLAIAVFGGFSIGYVPSQILVAGDAAATATNLISKFSLFQFGVLADSAVIFLEIILSVLLFQMFHATSPRLALIALVSRLGMVVIMGINLLFWVMPYLLLSQQGDGASIQTQMLAQSFFDAHTLGVYVWGVFFGTHLLALGWIILRTQQAPQILGWGLFIGAFGYVLEGLAALASIEITALDYTIIGLLVIVSLSEISFGFWLLLRKSK